MYNRKCWIKTCCWYTILLMKHISIFVQYKGHKDDVQWLYPTKAIILGKSNLLIVSLLVIQSKSLCTFLDEGEERQAETSFTTPPTDLISLYFRFFTVVLLKVIIKLASRLHGHAPFTRAEVWERAFTAFNLESRMSRWISWSACGIGLDVVVIQPHHRGYRVVSKLYFFLSIDLSIRIATNM